MFNLITIVTLLLPTIGGVILPGPCPVFPPSNDSREMETTAVLTLVPFESRPDSYLFGHGLNKTCNSIFFSKTYFRWEVIVKTRFGNTMCKNAIISAFDRREDKHLFLGSDLVNGSDYYCRDGKVYEKIQLFHEEGVHLIWSCYDVGDDSKEHDAALIIAVNNPLLSKLPVDVPKFHRHVTTAKEMVRNKLGIGVYDVIKDWPLEDNATFCNPVDTCPIHTCVAKKRFVIKHIVIIAVVFVVLLLILVKCMIF